MTRIQNTRELPAGDLRAYVVKDEAEARQIVGDGKGYLYEQVTGALYLYVRPNEEN